MCSLEHIALACQSCRVNTFLAQRPLRAFRFEIPLSDRDMLRLGQQLASILAGRGYLVDTETDKQGGVEVITFQRVVEFPQAPHSLRPPRPAA